MRNFIFLAGFIFSSLIVTGHAATLTLDSGTYMWGSDYVGPLSATLDNSSITIYCDDFSHQVSFGESWTVSENSFQEIPNTRWQSVPVYQHDVWLITQMSSNIIQVTAIQQAIWMQESSDPSLVNTQSTYWYNLAAEQNYSNFDFSAYTILTPTDPNNYQEMITMNPLPTPEPSSWALFMLAVPGLIGAWWRSRRLLA